MTTFSDTNNTIYKKLCVAAKIDSLEKLKIFDGYAASKSKIQAWSQLKKNKNFLAMPEEALNHFLVYLLGHPESKISAISKRLLIEGINDRWATFIELDSLIEEIRGKK